MADTAPSSSRSRTKNSSLGELENGTGVRRVSRASRSKLEENGKAHFENGGNGQRRSNGNGNAHGKSQGNGNGNGNGNGRIHESGNQRLNGSHRKSPEEKLFEALSSLADGDFSARLGVRDGAAPEVLEAFNALAARLDRLSRRIVELSRVVGRDGDMTARFDAEGWSGGWATIGESFNALVGDLARPSTEVARVLSAVAAGNLSQKMPLEIDGKPVRGEFLRIGTTVNTMVDELNGLAREVTRVAREVGTEGKLGGQAHVPGVAGTWKDLTDSVNRMASNLTTQVRGIAGVVTAVANGDLSKKLVLETQGEILELKNTVNTMVDQLNAFANEVTRVAREVGTEGKLGGQARVPDVAGTWKDLTDNVNSMASNLTVQLRDVSKVATAIANGDLTQKVTVEVKGEILQIKNVINQMVDSLNTFASEVTRVAREVGTEGKLGGLASVPSVAGTWKDLTDNVNNMASNLTDQVRNIALVTTAIANGDLSKKITVDVKGELLELKNTINTTVDQLRSFSAEVTRVAREVGTDGKLGGQAHVPGVGGTWKDLTDNVNNMASNLTTQVRGIAKVVTAVANGDLSKRLVVEAKGEIAELADTINGVTDTLRVFADQVTRVAREVGSEGKLGGQAHVPGVAGTWKDLTDSVNGMASNLTTQVRGIVRVVTAVANGDLSQKFLMESQGEIAALADTINTMTDTLRVFADQVSTVARAVGTEGKLGGQAKVPGASGTWRDLTDNVNQLANNLTTQVRAMSEVATAVTEGDLTRSITVEAQGELLAFKERVNQMITNLRETTQKNREQDWLKTNLAKFGASMQGQKSLESVSSMIMSELTPLVGASHGAFFVQDDYDGTLRLLATYAFRERKNLGNRFRRGEGLVGQCALEKKSILLTNVPADYVQISSGLGEAPARNVLVLPILFEGEVRAVIELASFESFSAVHRIFLDQLSESIGVVLNVIAANSRTEGLLNQSQSLAGELQQQQEELKRSNAELAEQAKSLRESEEMLKEQQEELQQVNEELEEKAALLVEQKKAVEQKNREVELARSALEDKADQLATSGRYKSEFLANMSHELRTPLNSLLILARMLADNKDENLTAKQVEYARTIGAAGTDLLNLINDVLDLSKVEAGKVEIIGNEVDLPELLEQLERTFRPLAQQKGIGLSLELDPQVPPIFESDLQRLMQILRNLIGNAFKFTETGSVTVNVAFAGPKASFVSESLSRSTSRILSFSVTDTGIGIPRDKQRLIFEAFHQADGTTSRKYGGTGLGLSISRELARLLGGEIRVESEPGRGSSFTLYLPFDFVTPSDESRPPPSGFGLGPAPVLDDRAEISPYDRVLLIVESDLEVAQALLGAGRRHGFKGVVATSPVGLADAAKQLKPDAIVLDLHLPNQSGPATLEALKKQPETAQIPIHVLSDENRRLESLRLGAQAHIQKPISAELVNDALERLSKMLEKRPSSVLIVEDDATQRHGLGELLARSDVTVTAVASAEEAIERLAQESFDGMVLDLGLPGASGFELVERLSKSPDLKELPVVIYTSRELSRTEEMQLKERVRAIILKDARSPTRLLEETSLFLHSVERRLPARKRPDPAVGRDGELAGKTVLVIDDDVRNIFALTTMLEERGLKVLFAENGRDGLTLLDSHPEVTLVLTDVMMPEMDGYDTMRAIRANPSYADLPIIALTAKAMKGDREKCLEAGASDYVTKPVEPERLLSLLRVWLYVPEASV